MIFIYSEFKTIIHMKLKQVTVAAACVGMTLVACQKTKPPVAANHLKGTDDIETFFETNRANGEESFSVDPTKDEHLYAADGTEILIDAGTIRTLTGGTLTEGVELKINTVYSRWPMLKYNMPTETASDDATVAATGGKPLETGGSYGISIKTESGANVSIVDGGITILGPAGLTGGMNTSMSVWEAAQSTDQERDMGWTVSTLALGTVGSTTYSVPVPSNKPILPDFWDDKWYVNTDWCFTGKSGGSLIPKVTLPSGYTPTNTEIFIARKDHLYALTSLDVYTSASSGDYWTDNVGYFGEDETGYVIVVAIVDGDLHANITEFSATSNQTINITSIPLTSLTSLQSNVEALP